MGLDYLKVVQRQMTPEVYRRFVACHEQRIGEALNRYAGNRRVRPKYSCLQPTLVRTRQGFHRRPCSSG